MACHASIDAIERVWREESARLVGGLVRLVRDVGLAEDLAQDALLAALDRWPASGIPANPGAWLMTTARNRALDGLRRREMLERKHAQLAHEPRPEVSEPPLEPPPTDDVGDDVLRLMLIACHPVLSREARVALTLKLLGGLSTGEIARAFLVAEPTVAQRIVRAKRTLSEARVPFEVPTGEALSARLASVLEVVYLVFNEGYAATRGDDWVRPALCDDALRLAHTLADLVPGEAEVHGLVALLELQASRLEARTDANGDAVLLLEQDRTRWDRVRIDRGLRALQRADALARPLGVYSLQAAIASCHARAVTPEATDWERIVALYDALVEVTQSPIVALNRAVAVGMAFGPDEGLELVDTLADAPVLEGYHLLPAVRADLLAKLGRTEEARAELERAAFLAQNAKERALLLERARSLVESGDGR
ncbi:MAG: RNA polymerase sigma factor [Myxococcota bacterium]